MEYPKEYITLKNKFFKLKKELVQAKANNVEEEVLSGYWDEVEQCWYQILDCEQDYGFKIDFEPLKGI